MASRFISSTFLIDDDDDESHFEARQHQPRYHQQHLHRIKVFSTESNHPNALKQRQDIAALNINDDDAFEHVVLNEEQQRDFLESAFAADCGGQAAVARYDLLHHSQPHLAMQIWNYCALYLYGGLLLDPTSLLMVSLDSLIHPHNNINKINRANINDSMAVLQNVHLFPNSLYGSLLYLPQPRSSVSQGMLDLLLNSSSSLSIQQLHSNPLLLPQTLYNLVHNELVNETIQPGRLQQSNWYFLEQKCSAISPTKSWSTVTPFDDNLSRIQYQCPLERGHCCQVYDQEMSAVVATTRQPLLPLHILPSSDRLTKPFHQNGSFLIQDLPFISTIRQRLIPRTTSTSPLSPSNQTSAYDILSRRKCLPSNDCIYCLRTVYESNACNACRKECTCYCKTICKIQVPPQHVGKELRVTPPAHRRDPTRLIPRMVHQTWFEDIDADKYPHTSRFVESFRQSGWEYRFYTNDMAATFLSTHFPPPVRQAYDALLPGAFKADLFRYCVLLIHGGLYADVDILLESNLDAAIDPDVGFLAPIDSWPGYYEDHRSCLWNGFMAAAPGHPFLAKVIELVVNNARNRFTSVDYDHMFCPNPELSVLNAYDILFTSGPCILGAAVNQVLGRQGQTHIAEDELVVPLVTENDNATAATAIPGRTIILNSSKEDLGAHRFTLLEKNLIVAGTDFPDSDDRQKEPGLKKHYSSVHNILGVYGVKGLYRDKKRANEEIRLCIHG